ncbi:hypothetical protein GW764_01030 [Candidatus Parcubacteria bacterium]|nr:hypothetical protein [Candidatus Parcubacteria bacterium]
MLHKVFVSFDYTDDRRYRHLLQAWHENPKFQFVFDDATSGEINSINVGRIKAALTLKIKEATHILVIVGENANTPHRNRGLIGHKNWINFEINQAKKLGKRIAVVKLDRTYESPDELSGARVSWAFSFTEQNIVKALNEAPYPVLPFNRYGQF